MCLSDKNADRRLRHKEIDAQFQKMSVNTSLSLEVQQKCFELLEADTSTFSEKIDEYMNQSNILLEENDKINCEVKAILNMLYPKREYDPDMKDN